MKAQGNALGHLPIRGPFTALGRASDIRPGIHAGLCGEMPFCMLVFVLRAVYGPSRRRGLSQAGSHAILELPHAVKAAKALHIENARKTGVNFNAKTEK